MIDWIKPIVPDTRFSASILTELRAPEGNGDDWLPVVSVAQLNSINGVMSVLIGAGWSGKWS